LIRIDLSQEIEPGRYAYAKDLSSGATGRLSRCLLLLVTQAVQHLLLLHQVFTLNIPQIKLPQVSWTQVILGMRLLKRNTLS
jgi:hypothetical protein